MQNVVLSADLDARKSGSFKIGGEIEIHRLGFGAMRITGPGIWGPPVDRAEAIRTLKRVSELGIDFIDTADSYGPGVSEQLIREVWHSRRDQGRVKATQPGSLGKRRPSGVLAPTGYPKVVNGWGLSRSSSGSSTASIRKCRASNMRPSNRYKTMASSVTLG